jgi:hypothetical protein
LAAIRYGDFISRQTSERAEFSRQSIVVEKAPGCGFETPHIGFLLLDGSLSRQHLGSIGGVDTNLGRPYIVLRTFG